MKITVTEIRKAEFIEIPGVPRRCRISYEYLVRGDDIETKTFYNTESVEAYIEFIKEKQNDYSKVIKEIEI